MSIGIGLLGSTESLGWLWTRIAAAAYRWIDCALDFEKGRRTYLAVSIRSGTRRIIRLPSGAGGGRGIDFAMFQGTFRKRKRKVQRPDLPFL